MTDLADDKEQMEVGLVDESGRGLRGGCLRKGSEGKVQVLDRLEWSRRSLPVQIVQWYKPFDGSSHGLPSGNAGERVDRDEDGLLHLQHS